MSSLLPSDSGGRTMNKPLKNKCSCCGNYRNDCQPMKIVRKYSKDSRGFGFICLRCWRGEGPSMPVVYFP